MPPQNPKDPTAEIERIAKRFQSHDQGIVDQVLEQAGVSRDQLPSPLVPICKDCQCEIGRFNSPEELFKFFEGDMTKFGLTIQAITDTGVVKPICSRCEQERIRFNNA